MFKNRIEDMMQAMLKAADHECPGCLQHFTKNATILEAQNNCKLVAWQVNGHEVDMFFAKGTGEIVEIVSLEGVGH